MSRFLVPLGAFVLLALVLGVGIWHSADKGLIASPLIGKPAPQFSLPDLNDPQRLVHSAALKGRWYLFNVWGTWCGECRAEHDMLLTMHRSGRVPIVGLDWKDEEATALEWLKQLGNPYDTVAVDRAGREAIEWGVYAAPETFLVNPEGVIVYKHLGAITPETWSREILPRLPPASAGRS